MLPSFPRPHACTYALVISCLLTPAASAQPQPRPPQIDLNVLTTDARSGLAAHDWLRRLQQLPIRTVRIRSANERSRPAIDPDPTTGTIVVTGLLTNADQLVLPNVTFTIDEVGRMRSWFADLAKPAKVEQEEVFSFGMSATQLVAVSERLAATVVESTSDRPVIEAMRGFRKLVDTPISIDSQSRRLMVDEVVHDELQGLSVGTALAAVLRPLGLGLIPIVDHETTRLTIKPFDQTDEHWPVGWPREQDAHEIVPKLQAFVTIDIQDASLEKALRVLQTRLNVPFLFDHNGMAREQIDLATQSVSFGSRKTVYSRILKNLLFQGRLQYEVRTDEADRPFLWISPPSNR